MKTFTALAALSAVTSVFAIPSPTEPELAARASSGSLPTVKVQGNAFFAGSSRFYIRGIDYQPGGSSQLADPIADEAGCTRDISYFQQLGLNAIRVYTVDNSANHDACMNALAAAGIYLILDVNSPLYSINQDDPSPSYNSVYLQNVFATIDAFHNYTNTLAFFSGNEVCNLPNNTNAAPYVKATTRDMKSYMAARAYRAIPVGYSAADVNEFRLEMAEYMNCGTADERSDFYAFNDYSWCNTDFVTSGWDQKVKNFTGYGIPLFLSEYGCITNGRSFGEVNALYNTEMTSVYSGGLVYEYSNEASGYGVVTISGSTVTPNKDFTALQTALKGQSNPSGDGGYNSTGGASGCPVESSNWQVSNDDLPAIPSGAADLFKSGAGPGVGLNGAGSQNAGGTSTGTATPGSGSVTSTSTATGKKSVGTTLQPFDRSPMIVGFVVIAFTFLGAALL